MPMVGGAGPRVSRCVGRMPAPPGSARCPAGRSLTSDRSRSMPRIPTRGFASRAIRVVTLPHCLLPVPDGIHGDPRPGLIEPAFAAGCSVVIGRRDTRLARLLSTAHRVANRPIRDQVDSKVADIVSQGRLAEDLEVGHPTSPVAGHAPELWGVDRGVKEHAGEPRGQAIEDVRDESRVVLDVAPPRHDPAAIEAGWPRSSHSAAPTSEPVPRLGGVPEIARRMKGGNPRSRPAWR